MSPDSIGREALRKASWRLLPLLGLGYGIAYMDRVNISFASLQMNEDLHFSAAVYGLGGGLFFLSYALLEVPSNLMLVRFGARRWLFRIMLTWGVIAVGMMFVQTPMQFYIMRFLLGAAEAGFFPGVVYYLMQWFPAEQRGKAISRFYVALPLSSAVMGAMSGALLDLRGTLGLAGWQWLFLVQGSPAIILSFVLLKFLPDGPATARWLTEAERDWIAQKLAADNTGHGVQSDQGVLRALTNPLVWMLGIASICILGSSYAFTLSAPAILMQATGLEVAEVGFLTAGVALLSAFAMLLAGWHSDHRRERYLHVVAFMLLLSCAYLSLSLSTAPLLLVFAYATTVLAGNANQAVFWLIPSDVLRGRSAAAGVAAIGSIGMIGSFLGPYAWGIAKDSTGNYQLGLMGVALAFFIAGIIVLCLWWWNRKVQAQAPFVHNQL